jgi:hypothetical protein
MEGSCAGAGTAAMATAQTAFMGAKMVDRMNDHRIRTIIAGGKWKATR